MSETSTRLRRISRRRFMGLVTAAAAGAALPAGKLAAQAATAAQKPPAKAKPAGAKAAPAARPAGAPGFSEAERKEIARLSGQIDEALAKIRAYRLPAGAPPATQFAVLRQGKGRR